MRRRHNDAGGIDQIEKRPIVGKGLRVLPASDGLSLLVIDVRDGDEFDVGKACQDACVFLAEMSNADDRHANPFHATVLFRHEPGFV
jgi:hypothetical protein